jgi:hypothetical protein
LSIFNLTVGGVRLKKNFIKKNLNKNF